MRRPALLLSLLLLAVSPTAASAAGGPVAGAAAGGAGVTAPGSISRFVTVQSGGPNPVMRIARTGGTVERSRSLRGSFVVAAAASDGVGTGLSADGRTLVLAPTRTTFP